MVCHDLCSLIWRHHFQPAFFRSVDAVDEIIQPRFVVRPLTGPKFYEPVENFLRDDLSVFRIHPIVRIAERMHVSLRTSHLPAWNLEDLRLERSIQITG